MAIVELIEEVKNEREKLKEMNDDEFKKRWEKYIIDEENCKHDKELKEKLKEAKNEQEKLFEKKSVKLKTENTKKLAEKLQNIQNEGRKVWEEKLKIMKIEHTKLFEQRINIEKRRKILLEKYNDFIIELKETW
ncbi:unnamed protein product [Meloidogyne enterolobii]|uniref:Uncharacterized protein n=1 Tax=Meloidogyne enterolobii TaxID=390850 RepID=A0ACB1A7W6_MELEN